MSSKQPTIWGLVSLTSILIFIVEQTKGSSDTTIVDNTKPVEKDFRTAYITQNYPYAKSAETQYQVPALFSIAQAGLESNFGTSDIAVNSNNQFGIKADASWTGDTYTAKDGIQYRKYDTIQDSFNDHGKFLVTNQRYSNAFNISDPYSFAQAIANDGYSDSTNYFTLISNVMDSVKSITG
jgi:flagellum-specific peptidoglycan hydrolase FlgJ